LQLSAWMPPTAYFFLPPWQASLTPFWNFGWLFIMTLLLATNRSKFLWSK
jgi:hypothetical protein